LRRQNESGDRYVLDSSAFFALFEDEKGADIVQELLGKAREGTITIFVSFASYVELFYVTYRKEGKQKAQRQLDLMSKLKINRVDSSRELGLVAGMLKAVHRVSFADAWIAATAIMLDATLVHKDPEFEALEGKLEILRLPYKKG
jgi:predicted nucleic acid-binding protein